MAALTALLVCAGALPLAASAAQADPAFQRAHREYDAQTMHNVYLLPDSDTYYISVSDVSWMDDEELMLARNEFYARRGRKFVTASIRDYFNRQSWYQGWIEPDDFTSDMFNRYEQANVDFIVSYEAKRKEKREAQLRGQEAARKKPDGEKKKENGLNDANPTADKKTARRYREVVNLYSGALAQDWPREASALAGVSGAVGDLLAAVEEPKDLGYAYRDLDGDGSAELLIGPTEERQDGAGAVYAIYTLRDGEPVAVAESGENSIFFVCEDDTVYCERFFGDGRWEVDYYDFEDGGLQLKSLLAMDEDVDRAKPWFAIDDARALAEDMPAISDGLGRLAENMDADDAGAGVALADGFDGREEVEEEDAEEAAYCTSAMRVLGEEAFDAISYEEASEMRAAHVAKAPDWTPFD